MVCARTTISNISVVHMRPAQALVRAVSPFPCRVTLQVEDKTVNGKSILSVMAAGLKQGSRVTIYCDGPQEQQALVAALKAIASGLGETQ